MLFSEKEKEVIFMSQYIEVSTPSGDSYRTNRAIVELLSYLGKEYKVTHPARRIQRKSDYRVGRNYIADMCGKGFKTAIDNMAESAVKQTGYNCSYRNWRFHRIKARKFLTILFFTLKKYNVNDDVWSVFDRVYSEISGIFPVEQKGSDVISCPYLSALNQAKISSDYCIADRNSLARIVKIFPAFDRFYPG